MDFPHSQQLSMGNSTLPSGFSHVSLEPYKPSTSKLYKAFLNDPMLSDVTIRLGDRSLYAHRIVLCRGSEYFARMLTGRFQESSSKVIELHGDDPDAIFALLRFLYGLPYDAEANSKWLTSLSPHAQVYVVADKYQLDPLKEAIAENMRKIITAKSYTHPTGYLRYCNTFKNFDDFFSAFQVILEITTPSDTLARKVLVDFVIQNIDFFKKQKELLSLFQVYPELAVAIISHPDLEIEAEGTWMCSEDSCVTSVPGCSKCNHLFEPYFLRRYRYDDQWQCPICKSVDPASCSECKSSISWVPESAGDSSEEESDDGEQDGMDLDDGVDAVGNASR